MINLNDCITLVSVKTYPPSHILQIGPCLMAGRHQLLDGGGVRYAALYMQRCTNSTLWSKGRGWYCDVISIHLLSAAEF